jgi:hypothetical protein
VVTNPPSGFTDADLGGFLGLFIILVVITLWAWISRKRFKPNSQGSMGGGPIPSTGSVMLSDIGEAFAHVPREMAKFLAGVVAAVLWIGWVLLLVACVVLVGIVALAIIVWAFRTLGL